MVKTLCSKCDRSKVKRHSDAINSLYAMYFTQGYSADMKEAILRLFCYHSDVYANFVSLNCDRCK